MNIPWYPLIQLFCLLDSHCNHFRSFRKTVMLLAISRGCLYVSILKIFPFPAWMESYLVCKGSVVWYLGTQHFSRSNHGLATHHQI